MLSARHAKSLSEECNKDLNSYPSIFEEYIRTAANSGKEFCYVDISKNNFSWEDFRDSVSELLDNGYSLRIEELFISNSLLGGLEEELEKIVLRELSDVQFLTVDIYW